MEHNCQIQIYWARESGENRRWSMLSHGTQDRFESNFSSEQFNILYFRCSDSGGNTCYHQWSHVGHVLCKTWWYYRETVLQNIWGENYLLSLAESCEGTKLSWCNSPLANTSQTSEMWTILLGHFVQWIKMRRKIFCPSK